MVGLFIFLISASVRVLLVEVFRRPTSIHKDGRTVSGNKELNNTCSSFVQKNTTANCRPATKVI
jgi:hypothetical protein